MIEVLVIVPYEELLDDYRAEIEKANASGVHFTTSFAFGTAARSLEVVNGYDIVVVRGMTGLAIAKAYPELNIIDIHMDTSDIASSMLEVISLYGMDSKVGLTLPNSQICEIALLRTLTKLDIVLREEYDEDGLDCVIEDLKAQGCNVFVGGLTIDRLCNAKGYRSVFIKTGSTAIKKSIADALVAAQIMDRERTRMGLLKSLVDNNPDSLLVLDDKGRVSAANQAAKVFFKRDDVVGMCIDDLFPLSLSKVSEDLEIVQVIDGMLMLIAEHPFVSEGEKKGTFVSLRRVDDICSTEKKIRTELSKKGLFAKYHFSDIIASQVEMRELIAKAIRYAQVDGNVLVTGETGTGKELFVQSMHNASSRADKPFVAVNCAALSEQLLESELFGYTDGAFTGASKGGKMGLFELAQGGTIFLDEIGELPMRLQAKILRVLQEKEIRRIGGDEYVPIDVRIMCATNQDIPTLIEKGLFRRDLYYRINLITVRIPPLRSRKDDIPILFKHFVDVKSERMNRTPLRIEPDAIELLESYSWPGNIRELRNAAERIVILGSSSSITKDSILEVDLPINPEHLNPMGFHRIEGGSSKAKTLYEQYVESGMTLQEFASSHGISRTTLWRRLKDANA